MSDDAPVIIDDDEPEVEVIDLTDPTDEAVNVTLNNLVSPDTLQNDDSPRITVIHVTGSGEKKESKHAIKTRLLRLLRMKKLNMFSKNAAAGPTAVGQSEETKPEAKPTGVTPPCHHNGVPPETLKLFESKWETRTEAITAVKLHSTLQRHRAVTKRKECGGRRLVFQCASFEANWKDDTSDTESDNESSKGKKSSRRRSKTKNKRRRQSKKSKKKTKKKHSKTTAASAKSKDHRYKCNYRAVLTFSKSKQEWSFAMSSPQSLQHAQNCCCQPAITTEEALLHTKNTNVRQAVSTIQETRNKIALDNSIARHAISPYVANEVRLRHARVSTKNYKVTTHPQRTHNAITHSQRIHNALTTHPQRTNSPGKLEQARRMGPSLDVKQSRFKISS